MTKEKAMDKARELIKEIKAHTPKELWDDSEPKPRWTSDSFLLKAVRVIETLQARVRELEQSNKDLRHEMHMMIGSREKIQSLEARLALVTELNRTRGYPTGQEWTDLIKKLQGDQP